MFNTKLNKLNDFIDWSELVTKFDELATVMAEAKAKIEAEGKRALKEYLEDTFIAYPQIKAIGWTQYTPYFNDGDECIFSVREPQLLLAESQKDDEEDYEDEFGPGWRDSYSFYDYVEDKTQTPRQSTKYNPNTRKHEPYDYYPRVKVYATPEDEALYGLLNNLYTSFQQNQEILKSVFGDHVRVKAYADGNIEIEPYYHD